MQQISRVLGIGLGSFFAVTAMAQPCIAPSWASATPADRCSSIEVRLSAANRGAVTSFRLFRKIGIDSTPQLMAEFAPPLPYYWTDTTAPAHAALYYQLEAWVDTCVKRSDWEQTQRSSQTRAPMSFAASDMTQCGQIELTWVDASPCGGNTTLYRAEYPEFGAAVPIKRGAWYGYIDSDVEVNTPYFYWATSTSPLGESVAVGPVLGRASPSASPRFLIRNPHVHAVPTTRYNLELDVAVVAGVVGEYQWFKDGVALFDGARISGARSSVLTFVGCEFDDAGEYRLVATNACGTATSDPIQVDVGLERCFGWCRPDTNADGATDGRDIQYFLDLWVNSEPCADWNLDGGIDGSDLMEYMYAWELWCC